MITKDLHAVPVRANKHTRQFEANCIGCDQQVATWTFEAVPKGTSVPRAVLHNCPGRNRG